MTNKRNARLEDLDETFKEVLTKALGVRKTNKDLPFAKDVSRWVRAALTELGHKTKKVHWQANDELGRDVGCAIARAKYIEIWGVKYFTYLEFGPLFFENTTGAKQRKEIVYHEIAHVVDCWNGSKRLGHGKSWKLLMKQFGLPAKTCYALYD